MATPRDKNTRAEAVATELFPGQSAIDKSILVGYNHFFRVVGVLNYRTPSAGIGSSLAASDCSRIGDVLFKREQGSVTRQRLELSQITIEVANRYQVKSTAQTIESLMAVNHPDRDYSITIPLDLIEQAQATQRIFNVVLGATEDHHHDWITSHRLRSLSSRWNSLRHLPATSSETRSN